MSANGSFLVPPSPSSSNFQSTDDETEEIDLTGDNSTVSIPAPGKERHGGKPKCHIWSQFQQVESVISGKGTIMQRCISCNLMVSSRADRMRVHFSKCQQNIGRREKLRNENDSSTSCDTDGPSSPLPTPSKQRKISGYALSTTVQKKAELDKLLARFWYSANLPFSAAGLKTWKDACEALRPGYEPPGEEALSDRLLELTHEELYAEMTENLKGKSGVLIQDGWSNIHNAPILTHTIVYDGEAYLLNSIECGAEKKTSEYCSEMFEEAMEMAKTFDFHIVAGSTDNANTMVRMREILKEKYPTMLFYGCSPHMLNHLCEDISPKQIISKIVEVSKYFRDHHRPAALLKERNGLKPQLPAATRWSSHLDCVRVFLKNRTKFIEISQLDGACSNNVTETVNSLAIFKTSQDLVAQMEEITGKIMKLQSDSANVADACHCWYQLLNNPILACYKAQVARRMSVAIEDFFLVAYYFHPKYQGELLTQDDEEKCHEILLENDPSWVLIAQGFRTKNARIFSKTALHPEVMSMADPYDWWANMNGNPQIPKELINYLLPMYRCPSSTASVERVFSTFGFIQSDKRNRLGQEKLTKLGFCFRALRKPDMKKRKPRNILGNASSSPVAYEDSE